MFIFRRERERERGMLCYIVNNKYIIKKVATNYLGNELDMHISLSSHTRVTLFYFYSLFRMDYDRLR